MVTFFLSAEFAFSTGQTGAVGGGRFTSNLAVSSTPR